VTPKTYGEVFLYIAAITGLPWALGMAAILQESPATWIVAGFIFGMLMALFATPKLVGETGVLEYTDKEQFVGALNVASSQIGYQLKTRVGDFLTYEVTQGSSFTLGLIKVAPASYLTLGAQLTGGRATLVGPRKAIMDLGQRLRAVDPTRSG